MITKLNVIFLFSIDCFVLSATIGLIVTIKDLCLLSHLNDETMLTFCKKKIESFIISSITIWTRDLFPNVNIEFVTGYMVLWIRPNEEARGHTARNRDNINQKLHQLNQCQILKKIAKIKRVIINAQEWFSLWSLTLNENSLYSLCLKAKCNKTMALLLHKNLHPNMRN